MSIIFGRTSRLYAGVFVAILCCAPLALIAQSSAAAPAVPTYRAGLKSLTIPAPSADLAEIGSDYRVLLEPLAPDSNRLIAAFAHPDDLAAMRAGSSDGMQQYALVEVLRRAEFADITPEIFKQVADGMATQFGTTLDASLKDAQDQLNRSLKALNDNAATVSLDKPIQLGLLFSKPDACGFGVVMPVSAGGKTIKMATAVIVLRVQDRVVFAYLYNNYNDEDSVKWVRKTGEDWADAILAANK